MRHDAPFWDARYAEEGFAYGDAPSALVVEIEPGLPRRARVLCLAEGEGRNAAFLAEHGHDVTAVDLSAVGLEKAKSLAARRGVAIRTVVADLAELPIAEAAWDAIVAIWMHLPAPLLAGVLGRAAAGLASNGRLVIESYRKEQLALGTGGPRDLALLVDPIALRAMLEKAGLTIDRFDVIERDVHEGPYHDGRSAVVQVVARRA